MGGAAPGRGVPAVARFDDLIAGRSFCLAQPVGTIEAACPEDVAGAIAAAERAAADGRWVAGFVSYEAAPGLDPALAVPVGAPAPGGGLASSPVPLAWFGVFSSCRAVTGLVPTAGEAPGGGASGGGWPRWELDVDATTHAAQVARVRRHIAVGDVYQCNLTARYRCSGVADPFTLYHHLVLGQRAAYCTYLEGDGFAVASASPELFFEWSGDGLMVRPMKGTAPRGRWTEEDRARGAALQRSEKDRAENVMIVDLLRNDLGKIAVPGSVAVPELWALECYGSVWQLTSTVRCRPRAGTSLVDVFRALFPSGSVTGAPKHRSMQVIASLETSPRGVYCGAVGLLAPPGATDPGPGCVGAGPRARFNVAIRTAVVDHHGLATYGSGGGIVWDSDAAGELAELRVKAALLRPRRQEFSLIETMLAVPGTGVQRWSGHRRRLAGSVAYFGFRADLTSVEEHIRRAVSTLAVPSVLRLQLSRWGAVSVELEPLPPDEWPGGQRPPVRLAVDDRPVDPRSSFLYHKTTVRSLYEEAAARHPGADQVVLVNDRGQATETNVANLAVRLGGRWFTPDLESGCLPGVARAELVASGTLAERPLALTELAGAEALAVVSSLRGWRPAVLAGAAQRARADARAGLA